MRTLWLSVFFWGVAHTTAHALPKKCHTFLLDPDRLEELESNFLLPPHSRRVFSGVFSKDERMGRTGRGGILTAGAYLLNKPEKLLKSAQENGGIKTLWMGNFELENQGNELQLGTVVRIDSDAGFSPDQIERVLQALLRTPQNPLEAPEEPLTAQEIRESIVSVLNRLERLKVKNEFDAQKTWNRLIKDPPKRFPELSVQLDSAVGPSFTQAECDVAKRYLALLGEEPLTYLQYEELAKLLQKAGAGRPTIEMGFHILTDGPLQNYPSELLTPDGMWQEVMEPSRADLERIGVALETLRGWDSVNLVPLFEFTEGISRFTSTDPPDRLFTRYEYKTLRENLEKLKKQLSRINRRFIENYFL